MPRAAAPQGTIAETGHGQGPTKASEVPGPPGFHRFSIEIPAFSIEFPAFFIDFQPELAMFIGFLHAFPLQAEFTKAQKLHRKELGLGVLLDPATLWPKLNRSRVRPILNA